MMIQVRRWVEKHQPGGEWETGALAKLNEWRAQNPAAKILSLSSTHNRSIDLAGARWTIQVLYEEGE